MLRVEGGMLVRVSTKTTKRDSSGDRRRGGAWSARTQRATTTVASYPTRCTTTCRVHGLVDIRYCADVAVVVRCAWGWILPLVSD